MFSDEDRQRNLRSFQKRARILLTDSERDYLHDVLKHYQTYKDVHRLMMSLRSSLDTPAKLDLLREIRGLIPPGHLRQFDEMAPYDKMAHPFHPPGSDNTWRRMPSWHGRSSHPNPPSSDWIQSPNGVLSPIGDSRVITVDVDGEDIGFIIKGGAEQKMGIFVARVESNSDAEMSGLLAGDQLLEVNNISFEVIPIHTASTVLRSTNRLKMKVFTPPKASSHKDTHKGNKWFGGTGTVRAHIDKERTVLIQLDEDHQFIGFNIRGGSEYGLGVFVSRIDPGGLAELNGIKPGDQILEVNGQKLDNITHAQAVEIIRNQRNMIMRVRSTNKVPTYPRIEDNLPPPRSQSAVPSKNSSSPPSSHDGSLKSVPVPNKDWLIRTEPTSDKGFKDDLKRPGSAASSHSSKHSAKQVTGMGPTSGGPRDVQPPHQESSGGREVSRQEPEPRTSTPTRRKPRAGDKKGRKLGRSFSMKVTGEKQRPMLDRDDVYQKREKKGKTLKQMLFGSKSRQREKHSMEAVEEEDGNKSREDSRMEEEELNESSGEKKGRKSRGKVHGLLNSFRRTREDVKVRRRTPLDRQESQDLDDADLELSGNWATRKDTQATPDKTADMSSYGSIGKQRGLFVQGAGTQVMLASVTPPSNFAMLEDAARRVLTTDETKAVLRHLKRYEEEGDIDALVVPLLAILDQPEKLLLLGEVRGFILPKDIVRFDALVSKKELDALKKVRKQEKEGPGGTNSHRALHHTQSAEGYLENPNPPASSGDSNFALYSHIPALVNPEPIPVGPSEYVSIQTNDENNLARMKGKKVIISSNPEIIPRGDSYPETSSAELSPLGGTIDQFTFGASEADVIARLDSALGVNSKDENANSVLGHTASIPPVVTTVQRDFRGGFPASPTRQNPLQTFSSQPNPYSENISEDSDSSSNAQKVGSYGFGGGQQDIPSPERKVYSPTQRPSLPPPPPPPPLFANPPLVNPTDSVSNGVSGTGYSQSDPREALYAKVDKSRRRTSPEQSPYPRVTLEAPYASISEFDRLSMTSNESESRGSNAATPKRGILKNSFNNDLKRPNIEVRNPDVSDYEPFPLREISNEARKDDSRSFNLDASWPSSPRGDSFRVELSKNNPSLDSPKRHRDSNCMVSLDRQVGKMTLLGALYRRSPRVTVLLEACQGLTAGLSVSGGSDCKHQPSVKVDEIIPGGAAAEDGTLQVPYTLVGIDGRSLRNVTHDEAVDIIRQSYADKSVPYMSVEFLPTS